jgi:hypothetical protein
MNKIVYAALAAAFAVSVSTVPAAAQAGTGLGLIIHSSIVSKCQNRQLTQAEAEKTMWFPLTGIWQAMKDCRTVSESKKK